MTPTPPHRIALLNDAPPGQLLIHELYRSIQGESTYAGLPCVFVRLSVCNSRCVWCDSPHAFREGDWRPTGDVLRQALAFDCPLVEVTGGEPLLQPEVHPLMRGLADAGPTVLLETSGALEISSVDPRVRVILDIKCPDSGECDGNHWPNLDALRPSGEVKFVVASRRDFDWAVDVCRSHNLTERFPTLFSPAFGLVQPVDLAEWLLASGLHARMQLQMHKHIWDPKARGV